MWHSRGRNQTNVSNIYRCQWDPMRWHCFSGNQNCSAETCFAAIVIARYWIIQFDLTSVTGTWTCMTKHGSKAVGNVGRNYNDHQISNGQDCIPYLFVQCISWDPFLSVLHGNRHSMYAEIYMNLPTLSSIYYPLNLTTCQTKLPTFAGSLKNGVSSLLNSCCFAFHQEETPEAPSIGMSEGWGVGGWIFDKFSNFLNELVGNQQIPSILLKPIYLKDLHRCHD